MELPEAGKKGAGPQEENKTLKEEVKTLKEDLDSSRKGEEQTGTGVGPFASLLPGGPGQAPPASLIPSVIPKG